MTEEAFTPQALLKEHELRMNTLTVWLASVAGAHEKAAMAHRRQTMSLEKQEENPKH